MNTAFTTRLTTLRSPCIHRVHEHSVHEHSAFTNTQLRSRTQDAFTNTQLRSRTQGDARGCFFCKQAFFPGGGPAFLVDVHENPKRPEPRSGGQSVTNTGRVHEHSRVHEQGCVHEQRGVAFTKTAAFTNTLRSRCVHAYALRSLRSRCVLRSHCRHCVHGSLRSPETAFTSN